MGLNIVDINVFCSTFTNVFFILSHFGRHICCAADDRSSWEVNFNAMHSISSRFTYFTYLLWMCGQLDLADLESVRKFVEDFRATGRQLSVLVNNAGLCLNLKDARRQYSKDNFELTMATNHIGQYRHAVHCCLSQSLVATAPVAEKKFWWQLGSPYSHLPALFKLH